MKLYLFYKNNHYYYSIYYLITKKNVFNIKEKLIIFKVIISRPFLEI